MGDRDEKKFARYESFTFRSFTLSQLRRTRVNEGNSRVIMKFLDNLVYPLRMNVCIQWQRKKKKKKKTKMISLREN